jgi:hypothetical protein
MERRMFLKGAGASAGALTSIGAWAADTPPADLSPR